MKVQASTNSSAFFDNRLPHDEATEGDTIDMTIEDGVASVPKPALMLGYRPLDASGIMVEDKLPAFAPSVIEKYEATARLEAWINVIPSNVIPSDVS